MSTNFQIASFLGSIAFIFFVGIGFIVILTVPELSRRPIYPMLFVAGASFILSPLAGWFVASQIQRGRSSK
ncbi:hypothetical protein G3A39_43400 [Paraburkholderia aspalathi]|nr:hypothetical protein [Paraburkholderia aspalathi]